MTGYDTWLAGEVQEPRFEICAQVGTEEDWIYECIKQTDDPEEAEQALKDGYAVWENGVRVAKLGDSVNAAPDPEENMCFYRIETDELPF